jgi:hypothetical protein
MPMDVSLTAGRPPRRRWPCTTATLAGARSPWRRPPPVRPPQGTQPLRCEKRAGESGLLSVRCCGVQGRRRCLGAASRRRGRPGPMAMAAAARRRWTAAGSAWAPRLRTRSSWRAWATRCAACGAGRPTHSLSPVRGVRETRTGLRLALAASHVRTLRTRPMQPQRAPRLPYACCTSVVHVRELHRCRTRAERRRRCTWRWTRGPSATSTCCWCPSTTTPASWRCRPRRLRRRSGARLLTRAGTRASTRGEALVDGWSPVPSWCWKACTAASCGPLLHGLACGGAGTSSRCVRCTYPWVASWWPSSGGCRCATRAATTATSTSSASRPRPAGAEAALGGQRQLARPHT